MQLRLECCRALGALWGRFVLSALLVMPGVAGAVEWAASSDRLPVTPYAEVLEDPSHQWTSAQVRGIDKWQKPGFSAFNFGLSKSAWWVRLSVRNNSTTTQDLVLDLGTTQQDFVHWFVYTSEATEPDSSGRIGDFLDFRERPLQTRILAIPVKLGPDERADVYLRFHTSGTAFSIMNLGVSERQVFLSNEKRRDFRISLVYGVSLSSAVLGFLLFFAIYWAPAGLFGLFVMAFGVYAAAFWGSDIQHFLPHSPWLHHHMMVGSGVLAFVFGNAAAMTLIQVQRHVSKRTLYALIGLTGLTLSTWVWIALNDLGTSELLSFVSGPALLLLGWYVLGSLFFRQVAYVKPLFFIYSVMLAALFTYSLQLFGVFAATSSAVNIIQFAALLTLFVLGVFLALQVRIEVRSHSFKQARLAMVRYVAHDIRAPQASIISLLERPDCAALPSELREAIQDQVGRTIDLTDAFLWLSKAESSVYRFEPVFLGDLVHEAIDMAWPLLERKAMLIERIGLDDEGCQITADREMMGRCLFNLLDNAVKYSPSGSCIRVVMRRRGSRVLLSIEDRGVGMTKEFAAHAFAEFRRSKNSFAESGFGLGLAFVATVLEQHGASIACHTEPGQGTTFVLTFGSTALLPE